MHANGTHVILVVVVLVLLYLGLLSSTHFNQRCLLEISKSHCLMERCLRGGGGGDVWSKSFAFRSGIPWRWRCVTLVVPLCSQINTCYNNAYFMTPSHGPDQKSSQSETVGRTYLAAGIWRQIVLVMSKWSGMITTNWGIRRLLRVINMRTVSL